MQRRQRRGHRPLDTILLSEHRAGGVREFVFSPADPQHSGSARPLRALMTARSFSWADDPPAANDPAFADSPAGETGAAAQERDFEEFLRAVRRVYGAPRRGG